MSRREERKKITRSIVRSSVILIVVIISLAIIYRFNILTKSEIVNKIPVTAIELGTNKAVTEELEVFKDENGQYIILPDKISGFYVENYHVKEEDYLKLDDSKNQDNFNTNTESNDTNNLNSLNTTNTIDNTTMANTSTYSINTVANTVANTAITNILDNNNVVTNENVQNVANNTVVTNSSNNLSNSVEENIEENTVTNTAYNENIEKNSNENTISTDAETDSSENDNNVEKISQEESLFDKAISEQDGDIQNNIDISEAEKSDTVSASTEPVGSEDSANQNEETIENEINKVEYVDKLYKSGDKLYISYSDSEIKSFSINVDFQKMEVKGISLYKQELTTNNDSDIIKVTGFVPLDYYLDVKKEDNNKIEELKADVEELPNSSVLIAYDIKITNGENEFQPVDYYQDVNVSITSEKDFTNNLMGNSISIVHIIENEENNEIIFERIAVANKTEDTIECIANQFSTYAVVKVDVYTPTQVTANNYDNDYNYYIGRNFTDDISGVDSKKYTDDTLAEVTVNYYSYDYSKNINEPEDLTITNCTWAANQYGNPNISSHQERDPNNYWNQYTVYDYYYVTYDVTITVNSPSGKYFDTNRPLTMSFDMPNSLRLDTLQSDNGNRFSSTPTYTSGKLTLSENNFSRWTKNSINSYQTTIRLQFNLADNSTTIGSVNINSVSNFSLLAKDRILTGYISADAEERQTLFTYNICVPMDSSGNVKFELIDNPYMDRPEDFGFDGWKSNETYTITTDNATKVQTLTAGTTNKKATINLYPNWREANIIIVNPSATGNSDYNTGTMSTPVNSWTGINRLLGNNYKTATNASNRELNIIVITGGTLTNVNISNTYAYTITSLYNGHDYRYNGATLNVSDSVILNKDVQIDFVNITGPGRYNSYTDESYRDYWTGQTYYLNYKDGIGDLGTYIKGNCHNFRIGRGMMPLATNADRSTFTQVQGGKANNNDNRPYKLVVESGKYSNIQLGNASNAVSAYSTNAIGVFGCDYDRIKDTTKAENERNQNFFIFTKLSSRTRSEVVTAQDSSIPLYNMIVKSGQIGMGGFNYDANDDDKAYAGIYLGGHGYSGEDRGDRFLTIEGGQIANIVGGLSTTSGTTYKTNIYVKGGKIINIVGGAGRSTTYGDRVIQITDGEIAYSVSGGSNGFKSTNEEGQNGELQGNTLVYIGGNSIIGTEVGNDLYEVSAGCVLGAGNGNSTATSAGKVLTSHIIVDGNATIKNRVYGGGNYGVVGPKTAQTTYDYDIITFVNKSNSFTGGEEYLISTGTTNGSNVISSTNTNPYSNSLSMTTISTRSYPNDDQKWTFESYGSGYRIRSASGYYIYRAGNNNIQFRSENNRRTTYFVQENGSGVVLYSGTGTRYYLRYSGGAFSTVTNINQATTFYLLQTEDVPPPEGISEDTEVTIDILGGKVENEVYGGSNQNNINGTVKINMEGGTITNAMYGGSNSKGTVTGNVNIDISGGTIGTEGTSADRVFGGGQGQPTVVSGKTNINISDKSENVKIYGDIYGGSALGKVTGDSTVTVKDITSDESAITLSGNIYGGGKGTTSTPAVNGGDTTVVVDGGTYSSVKVFGGSNINGTIEGDVLVKIGESTGTTVNEVYGGGNQANITNITDSVNVYMYENATVTNAFNGGNSAGILGTVTQTPRGIYADGATVGNIYGGSNSSGSLTETFVYCDNGATIGNVYGGGYGGNTNVSEDTNVEIKGSTVVTGNVFGGGDSGPVAGNTDVNIASSTVQGTVYGGGNNATVGGNTATEITTSSVKKVYGGGNLGDVSGDTDVDIIKSTSTIIYGGGCSAPVSGSTDVYIEDSTASNVYGGGEGTAATVGENTSVQISGNEARTTISNNVYGGGDAGKVTGNTFVLVQNSDVTSTVYGGGNQADVNGSAYVTIEDTGTAQVVYGGGNKGKVGTNTNVNINSVTISDTVYGGGNQGEVTGTTYVVVDNGTITNNIFGGGKAANVGSSTIIVQNSSTSDYIYGGGDQGEVINNTKVTIDNSTVSSNIYAGGNGSTVVVGSTTPGQVQGNTELIIRNNSEISGSVFGGGRGITANVEGNTDVTITNSNIGEELYGGGDNGSVQGLTDVELDSSTVTGSAYAGGKGVTATVGGNTNFEITNGTIGIDVYGGGNNGIVTGNTEVRLTNTSITGSAYAAGNGENAVVRGNTHIIAEGTTNIGESIYGGGNAAATGTQWTLDNSSTWTGITSRVDISGATIGENAYGGANSSVIYGDTVVNIGNKAINDYYGEDKEYIQGKIDIKGTIYGGGEQMDPTKEYNYETVSVEGNVLINVDGTGYDTDGKTINIEGSIFGSGHASRAAIPQNDGGAKIYIENNGTINIRNYGNIDNPKKLLSIQRAQVVLLDNSALWISGATDSTNWLGDVYFTFNIIDALKIKNGTTLYLRNGANRLSSFYSQVGDDGEEELAAVNIDRENGRIISKNVDNRIYMYSGNNLNISPSEKLETYGQVKGMTFFGIYKNSSQEVTGDDDEPGNELAGIFTGIYDKDYTVGGSINWADRDYNRCYVVGLHKKVVDPVTGEVTEEHDITVDGFYTNFEQLDESIEHEDNITEDIYNATSYTDYITPTPDDDIYYMWYAGPDAEIYPFNLTLTASKFSTLGTEELFLLGLSKPNAKMTLHSVDAELVSGVRLVDKNTIPNVNLNQDDANNVFGLTVKTGTTGWSMTGSTDFYGDDAGNSSADGTRQYKSENSTITPSLSFYLYHSNNITLKRDLGYYTITYDFEYWKDALNRKKATVIITLLLRTDDNDYLGYNGAITPGTQYELFTTTETNITTNSSFSAFFELAQSNFKQIDNIRNFYDTSYRVIYSEYVFPENTTITMIDRHDNTHPSYYYYTVTPNDVLNSKREFRFSEFIAMGSTNEPFDENAKKDEFYIDSLDYEYESFIFIVNFESAKFNGLSESQLLVAKDQHFRIYMKATVDDREEMLFSLIDSQIDPMKFGLYNTSSKIKIDAEISKPRIYLGNKDVTLDISTNYEVTIIDSVRVHDTQYFDKKLGVKLTLFDRGTGEVINGSSLLGTYFELDGEKFYPRTDGTTRIKIAEKVSNASSSIVFNTDNSTLESGSYYILVESFGSADGIYFGIYASDSDTVNLVILNDIYGLDSYIPEEQVIIDKKTGHTLEEETGYTSEENNKLDIKVNYLSGLANPYITIKLYRRDYEHEYDLTYSLVDLKNYVSETLVGLDEEHPNEYEAIRTQTIDSKVEDDTVAVDFDLDYTLKENLVTGTYKVVFTLYDKTDYQEPEVVYNEETDQYETTGRMVDKTDYEPIGETFSYIIIK